MKKIERVAWGVLIGGLLAAAFMFAGIITQLSGALVKSL